MFWLQSGGSVGWESGDQGPLEGYVLFVTLALSESFLYTDTLFSSIGSSSHCPSHCSHGDGNRIRPLGSLVAHFPQSQTLFLRSLHTGRPPGAPEQADHAPASDPPVCFRRRKVRCFSSLGQVDGHIAGLRHVSGSVTPTSPHCLGCCGLSWSLLSWGHGCP